MGGAPCDFPFNYKDGQTYYGCTLVDHDQPWCATGPSTWGNCRCEGQDSSEEFKIFDSNKDGRVSYSEMLDAAVADSDHSREEVTADFMKTVKPTFHKADSNNDWHLDQGEFGLFMGLYTANDAIE